LQQRADEENKKELENLDAEQPVNKKRGWKAKKAVPKSRPLTAKTILAIGMSARRALCVHPEVSKYTEREKVDAECFKRTARWHRAENEGQSGLLCNYFENLELMNEQNHLPHINGVYTLEDLRAFGRKEKVCPYYLARQLVREANVVVCNYPYLIDTGVMNVVYGKAEDDSIVVFDEAHNIDNLCIDSLTVKVNKGVLESATRHLSVIKQKTSEKNDHIIDNIGKEYENMVATLKDEQAKKKATEKMDSTDFSEAIPGTIRKAEHFISFLSRILVFLKTFIKIKDVRILSSADFLDEIEKQSMVDRKTLGFCQRRFQQLVQTLEITEVDEMSTLTMITQFMTLLATYQEGFKIILEPYQDTSSVPDPLLQFCCLDASIALKPVLDKFKALVMTSGTMSPLNIYPKMLGFEATLLKSVNARLPRNSISPMIICKGTDQVPLTSEFSERGNQMSSVTMAHC
jgi:DNA excision repair protein ERCC-2